MIGERIRQSRLRRRLSLAQLAAKAKISVATLSRMENGKQPVDVAMLTTLARLFRVPPATLLDGSSAGSTTIDTLVGEVVALAPQERAQLLRDVAAAKKKQPRGARTKPAALLHDVDELLAQIDALRLEVERIHADVRKETSRSRK